MFRGKEDKLFYTMERIWFSCQEESDADVIRYNRTSRPLKGKFVHCEAIETIFSDLTKTTQEIISASSKTVRYEVNKCAKESISVSFYTADDIKRNKSIIDEFEKAYIDFATELGNDDVLKAYKRSKINHYVDCNCIMLSKAHKDDVVVYHLYCYGGNECVLNYSVSNFRADSAKRNLAGMMNKFLHIKDIDWFRDKGVSTYDWGNISSSINPNGIDKFKMSFGGEIVTVYNSFVGNTFLGRVLVVLYKMVRGK